MKAFPHRKTSGILYYRIKGLNSIRDQVVEGGGYWSGSSWIVPEAVAVKLGAVIMVRVKVKPYCHESGPSELWATKNDVARGRISRVECPICSKPVDAQIISVINNF